MKKSKLIDLVNKKINDFKKAEALIRTGAVFVANEKIVMPNELVDQNKVVEIRTPNKYVSRGALKLEHAIKHWKLDFKNKHVVDIGSSTGGFTQVALMHGAKHVYCIDSGTNQLDYELRVNKQTTVYENTNLKSIDSAMFNHQIDWVVCDVSFISLRFVFESVLNINSTNIQLILLIKPQFEAQRDLVEDRGIVNKKYHQEIINNVKNYDPINYEFIDCVQSPITGKKSKNIEYLAYFKRRQNER